MEIQTPVPKVYPPTCVNQLRNISGLLNLDKIAEKIFGEMISADMKCQMDPSQYGNQKKTSIQHYLLNMLHMILSSLDKNKNGEQFAVIASLIDWKEAFPRQCPKLGIEAFIKMKVRPSLIPLLINFFQDRRMTVKWHGKLSEIKPLNGSGPQGSTIGLLEYLAQSNNNADCVEEENRFKFLDDLSILEVVNLLTVGISSYNVKHHIPNDIPSHNGFISAENLKTQGYINQISCWTENMKMKLNHKKSNIMVFNFTKGKQFSTRINMNGEILPVVKETKLLGTILTDDLKWDKNTASIVKKANSRLQLLRRAREYTDSVEDLKIIYFSYIRSLLEQSCNIWSSSLTEENITDLERVQKNSCRIIQKEKYLNYSKSLEDLDIESLSQRRLQLAKRFSQNCLNNEKTKKLFILNKSSHTMNTRKKNKYEVIKCTKERLKRSAVPFLQKTINDLEHQKKYEKTQ